MPGKLHVGTEGHNCPTLIVEKWKMTLKYKMKIQIQLRQSLNGMAMSLWLRQKKKVIPEMSNRLMEEISKTESPSIKGERNYQKNSKLVGRNPLW